LVLPNGRAGRRSAAHLCRWFASPVSRTPGVGETAEHGSTGQRRSTIAQGIAPHFGRRTARATPPAAYRFCGSREHSRRSRHLRISCSGRLSPSDDARGTLGLLQANAFRAVGGRWPAVMGTHRRPAGRVARGNPRLSRPQRPQETALDTGGSAARDRPGDQPHCRSGTGSDTRSFASKQPSRLIIESMRMLTADSLARPPRTRQRSTSTRLKAG